MVIFYPFLGNGVNLYQETAVKIYKPVIEGMKKRRCDERRWLIAVVYLRRCSTQHILR